MKTKVFSVLLLLASASVLSAQEAKYELKSAVIDKQTTAMGQTFATTWYMDDYGRKESSEVTVKVGGIANIEKHARTIVDGSTAITIDLDMKTAVKMTIPQKPVNYLHLTPEVREMYKIKETGDEEIAGKPCRKYELEITMMGQTAHVAVWVWKGIVLKSETSANGTVALTEIATQIQENVPVPPEKLTVPEGITVSQ